MRSALRGILGSLLVLSLFGACGEGPAPPAVRALDGLTTTTEIQGMRYDERGCFRAIEGAGTRTTPQPAPPCTDVVTDARDPAGNCWRFLTGCLPDGFTEIPSTEACSAVDSICVEALSCASDRFATSAGCLSCEEVRSTFQTRLAAIKSEYDACSADADCMDVAPTASVCSNDCGQAVRASAVEAYQRAVAGIHAAYCTEPARYSFSCAQFPVECPASHAVCTAGHCALSSL